MTSSISYQLMTILDVKEERENLMVTVNSKQYQHAESKERLDTPKKIRWFVGMMMSSVFTLVYLITPLYLLAAIFAILFQFPSRAWSIIFVTPIFASIILDPIASPWLVDNMKPILDYFKYDQIIETSKVDAREELLNGKNYIIAQQPHGVISFCAMCSAVSDGNHGSGKFRCHLRLAVASIVLKTPILKHVMGIFGIVSASKENLKEILKKPGVEGSVILYVGGMAELFMSSRKHERLFLSKRKGFIKLALTEGVDVIPVYLFGNTSVLTVVKTGVLANLSRKLQISLTYFWGKFNLPIPRDERLLYVGGQPLGMPQINEPTQEDIDFWHKKYCQEVIRLFDTYKEKVDMYKHKTLIID